MGYYDQFLSELSDLGVFQVSIMLLDSGAKIGVSAKFGDRRTSVRVDFKNGWDEEAKRKLRFEILGMRRGKAD